MAGDTIKGLILIVGRKAEQEIAIKSVKLVKLEGDSLGELKLDKKIHTYPDKQFIRKLLIVAKVVCKQYH